MGSLTQLSNTKSLADVKADMSALYEEVRSGKTDLKVAAELTNITGKFLKADALELAREAFSLRCPMPVLRIEDGRN